MVCLGSIENIKVIRAESLSDSAKLSNNIESDYKGFVKITVSRGSVAKTKMEKLDKLPSALFREVMMGNQ